jgi:hypothetical protein
MDLHWGAAERRTGTNSVDAMWAGVEDGWHDESSLGFGGDEWKESPVRQDNPSRHDDFGGAFEEEQREHEQPVQQPLKAPARDRSIDELDAITQTIRNRHDDMTGWERGLGLDPKWAQGMEKAVAKLGEPRSVTPPKKIKATKEMMDSAINRSALGMCGVGRQFTESELHLFGIDETGQASSMEEVELQESMFLDLALWESMCPKVCS